MHFIWPNVFLPRLCHSLFKDTDFCHSPEMPNSQSTVQGQNENSKKSLSLGEDIADLFILTQNEIFTFNSKVYIF